MIKFGWQNIIAQPTSALPSSRAIAGTVTGQYLDFWLASATDALYNTSGVAIVRDATGKSGTHIGHELDAYTWYELNRHVNVTAWVSATSSAAEARFWKRPPKALQHITTRISAIVNFKDNGKSR